MFAPTMLPSPDILNEYGEGKFVLANLAAKRAKQLKEGAIPLVSIESRHPLTIALAEIAAGKIEPRILSGSAEVIGESVDSAVLESDIVPGELGMLLPALDENEAVLIEAIGMEDADVEVEGDLIGDDISLSDLTEADVDEEVVTPAEGEEDHLSLSDIAQEEEAIEEGESDEE